MSIRQGKPDDVSFIVATWTRSYRDSLRHSERSETYWEAQKEVIASLLEHDGTLLLVATDDTGRIEGWACGEPGEPTIVHYVYVRQKCRRKGVARSLVERLRAKSKGVAVTHTTTPDVTKYIKARGWGTAYRLPWFRVHEAQQRRKSA